MPRYRVIASHTRSYVDALAVRQGESVTVLRNDTEWPGWVWCVNNLGVGGWLPERIASLSEEHESAAIVQEDFDTAELTTVPGETLEGTTRESGWIWMTNAAGQSGWVPELTVAAEE